MEVGVSEKGGNDWDWGPAELSCGVSLLLAGSLICQLDFSIRSPLPHSADRY